MKCENRKYCFSFGILGHLSFLGLKLGSFEVFRPVKICTFTNITLSEKCFCATIPPPPGATLWILFIYLFAFYLQLAKPHNTIYTS